MNYIASKISENILSGIFFALAVTCALFYTGNNPWLFTSSYIFIIFSLALVLKQRFHHSLPIHINSIVISSILLLCWFAISIFPSQVKYLTLYNFFWVGSLLIIFFIFVFSNYKDKIWLFTWPAILLLVTIWAIYGLVQYYYLHVPTNASFLNRNSLAALINLALLPASGYFLLNEQQRPWKIINNKILTITLIILFLSIFIITSRGASLSLALGFIILILLLRKHSDKTQLKTLFVIIGIAFLLSLLSQYFIQNVPQGFTERMMSLKDTSTAGNARFIIWESLIPLFKEMPWYGVGLGSLWLFWPPHRSAADTSAGFFAHNDYMQMTLEAGYPGIFLLLALLLAILTSFIRTLKLPSENNKLTLLQRTELVSLFAALTTFAAHSFFTYNFYILPLLLIAGIFLGRFNQLVSDTTSSIKTLPALKIYFKPITYTISLLGIILILCIYFISISLSSYYNNQAKVLMKKGEYQASDTLFLKSQKLAPLMDNPFFSHADLLRRGADRLRIKKPEQAQLLLKLAHTNLDKALKLNPLRPQSHHIRGLIYLHDQPEKAKTAFNQALKLDPRFLFSRIKLAEVLYREKQLRAAIEVLYYGVNYNYPINNAMLKYMKFFAKLSREAGVESYALHLEANIKKFMSQNSKKTQFNPQ